MKLNFVAANGGSHGGNGAELRPNKQSIAEYDMLERPYRFPQILSQTEGGGVIHIHSLSVIVHGNLLAKFYFYIIFIFILSHLKKCILQIYL